MTDDPLMAGYAEPGVPLPPAYLDRRTCPDPHDTRATPGGPPAAGDRVTLAHNTPVAEDITTFVFVDVEVTAPTGDGFRGRVVRRGCRDDADSEAPWPGDEVTFRPEHVLGISDPA